ncbi:MAG: hypothetical protein JXA30_15715 [Deltaproteobacteria bacterium]|nr:hypothetical protein [Deltaproteobacteria bacterium]
MFWIQANVPTVFALILAGGGVTLTLRSTPSWWFGGGLLVAAISLFWQIYRNPLLVFVERLKNPIQIGSMRLKPADLILQTIYLSILFVIASVMMADVISGDRPVSHDHTVHYVKAWQMHEYLLPRGRLFGWSHSWFAGYPAGYLYPIGTDLWVNAVYYLALGMLSFSQAYGVAFWLFHLLSGYAGYRFGRVVAGPHVGLISGILALTDISEFRFGGWEYTINYGVWPQSLSLAFALLAFCRLPGLAEGRRLSDIGVFGFWMGLALITHPIHLLFIPLVVTSATVAAAFAKEVRTAAAVFRLLLASLLAFLVAAVWLLPFFATKSYASTMGVWWDTTYEMGTGLLKLTAFPGTLGYVLAFGVLAIAILLRTRRFISLFTAFTAVLIPFLCSSSFIDEFHLPYLSEAFSRVQFIRISTMVKPFWFTLSALFLVAVLRSLRRLSEAEVTGFQRNARRNGADSFFVATSWALILGLVLVPIAVPALWAFWTRHVDKKLMVESERPLREERMQMVRWMKKNLPKDGFYRIGIFTGHEHDLLDLATELDRPLYKRGFTPCSNYVYKVRTKETEVLEAVNLRFALAKKVLDEERFELIKSYGELNLYRFIYWRPEPYEILEGSGKVRVERFADEEIVFRAAPGSSGVLRLNVSNFPRWHAYRDGRSIPITTTVLEQERAATGFMTVKLAPGRYRFVFQPDTVEQAGFPLSLLGILIASLLVLSDRREQGLLWVRKPILAATTLAQRLSDPGFYLIRLIGSTALGLGLLALGIALAYWQPPMVLENDDIPSIRRVRFDFLEKLYRANVGLEYQDIYRRCQRQKDRFVCPSQSGNWDIDSYVASYPATIREYKMVRCIRARPVDDALLSVIYTDVPRGDALIGYYGIEYEGRLLKLQRPVSFSIMVDGTTRYQAETERDAEMYWFNIAVGRPVGKRRASVAFSVEASNVRRRHLCFYAQMVDF